MLHTFKQILSDLELVAGPKSGGLVLAKVKNTTSDTLLRRTSIPCLKMFMDVNSIPPDKRVLTLLSSNGKETYNMLRNLLAPNRPRDTVWEDLVANLKTHFEPKPCSQSEDTL